MAQIVVFAIMLFAAGVPFVWMTAAMRKGQSGLVLTVNSLIGGALAILWFASGRPIGIDPMLATGFALLGFVPALLGSTAGTFLGWLLRRQDDRRV